MSPLLIYLHEVIDSRINTLDKTINQKLQHFFHIEDATQLPYQNISATLDDLELLDIIESHSHTKRLLLTLRGNLSPLNSDLVLELLKDDRFLAFHELELQTYIQQEIYGYA